jgi:recombination protein RecA
MSKKHEKHNPQTSGDVVELAPTRPAAMSERVKEKLAAVKSALDAIQKQFGKGAVMMMDGTEPEVPVGAIPTGSVGLDAALGIGGYPKGRVVEIFGPESSGKTTLTLTAIAQVQAAGGVAAFIDAEHALDVGYARKLGVKVEELLISQPDTGEQALEIAETLVRSGGVDLVVVDSVAALVPRAELEGEMGDQHVGLHARLMSQALRKLTACVAKTNCTIIFINQIRMKIGVMFGSPETTTGGNALKFYSSVRLDIRRTGPVKEGEQVVGSRTRVKVVKNKCAPPFREAEFDIVYGSGIARETELLDLAAARGIVERSGAWYAFAGDRIGQGREKAAEFLKSNPTTAAAIEKALAAHRDTAAPVTA